MDKVNEFEYGIDISTKARADSLFFSRLSNEQFRYTSSEDLLSTEKGKKALRDMIEAFFDIQRKRLDVLESYAQGDNYSILSGSRRLDSR